MELIPVIEIGYNNQGLTVPDKYPYWDNPEVWDAYHEESYQKAGFKDKFIPYLKGSSLYKFSDITDSNLAKLVIDQTQEMRDGKLERQQVSAFFGGYVLRVDEQDKYFPQCCGTLSDIVYWDKLANEQISSYEGHPSPQIKFEGRNIIFDFSTDEFDEHFQPTPVENIFSIDRFELKKAVEKVKAELLIFEKRLKKINEKDRLGIDNIGAILIWENKSCE
ncbi:MAG: hypothetical protein ACRYFZ_10250 [Janthinobacterium lividum]